MKWSLDTDNFTWFDNHNKQLAMYVHVLIYLVG